MRTSAAPSWSSVQLSATRPSRSVASEGSRAFAPTGAPRSLRMKLPLSWASVETERPNIRLTIRIVPVRRFFGPFGTLWSRIKCSFTRYHWPVARRGHRRRLPLHLPASLPPRLACRRTSSDAPVRHSGRPAQRPYSRGGRVHRSCAPAAVRHRPGPGHWFHGRQHTWRRRRGYRSVPFL